MNYLCSDLERHHDLPCGHYLHYALERHVLSQAVHVALEKRDGQGNFRFFVAADGGRVRIVKDPRWTSLGFDLPRINSSCGLLEELNLVQRDPGFQLTAAGEELLRALLEVG